MIMESCPEGEYAVALCGIHLRMGAVHGIAYTAVVRVGTNRFWSENRLLRDSPSSIFKRRLLGSIEKMCSLNRDVPRRQAQATTRCLLMAHSCLQAE